MRERCCCEKHGISWLLGDEPCKKCADEQRIDNVRILELNTTGKPIWPKSKAEKQAKII